MPTDELGGLKVALIHDWLVSYGGAERVVEELAALFPDAPIFTSVYDEKSMGKIFPASRIRSSYMQRIPGSKKFYRKMLSLMPRAFEEFDLSQYNLVLSSSSSCAKGVLTSSSTLHISYVHSPMRYAWDLYPEYLARAGALTRFAMRRQIPRIRQWDALSGQRADKLLANSCEVARRIKKVYGREATVLHPPVLTDFFTPKTDPERSDDYYLVVSRLVPYKRIDLAIEACKHLGRKLIVIGDGPQERELKRLSGPTIRFTGRISDREIREYYRGCRAFLFPGFEDFGMTPVESQACGRPVVAYGKGGVLDSVIPGKTGIFFEQQTADSLMEGIKNLEEHDWSSKDIRSHALIFSRDSFHTKLKSFINESLQQKANHKYRVL